MPDPIPPEAVRTVIQHEHERFCLGRTPDDLTEKQDLARHERDAARLLAALAEHGLAVVELCACGQPVGRCHSCGDPRCWHCDPGLGKHYKPMTCNSRHSLTVIREETSRG